MERSKVRMGVLAIIVLGCCIAKSVVHVGIELIGRDYFFELHFCKLPMVHKRQSPEDK